MSDTLRALIAEDQPLLRVGLSRILEAGGIEVVATADDADGLAAEIERDDIDLAILDVRLPPTHTTEGLEAAVAARGRRAGLPIMVLSQWVEPLYARDLLAAGDGSIGYLLKDRVADVDQFLDDLRHVAAGGTVLDPQVIGQLVGRQSGPLERLTDREREVLELMAEGRSNAGIAEQLVISEKAVGKHTGNIFMKLDLPVAGDDNRRVLAVLTWLDGNHS